MANPSRAHRLKPTGLGAPDEGAEPDTRLGATPAIPCAAKRWTRKQIEMMGADAGFLPAAYWPMPLVILESPYAGDINGNLAYARAAMRDSLNRGEAPIASHLLYTQKGILRDEVPEERQWGIDAGLAWREVADRAVFYVDRNWSGGMLAARKLYREEGFPYEVRTLAGEVLERFPAPESKAA